MKTTKKACTLLKTGVAAQHLWGVESNGMAPSELRRYRGKFARSLGIISGGSCTTTAYAMSQKHKDPGIEIPLRCVKEWALYLRHETRLTRALETAWPKIRAKGQKWSTV
eukprot:7477803-Karenia_brevis.AAC.1